MRRYATVTMMLGCLGLLACGDESQVANGDAATDSVADALTDTTPEVVPDTTPLDTTLPDTTLPDTGPDTSLDTSTPDTIADTLDAAGDADSSLPDAVPDAVADTTPDSTSDTTPDSTPDTTPDVGPPQGDNIFADGSFERWQDGLPIGWYGEASNLSTSDVHEDAREGHDGVRACGLVNASSTHRRMSSAPLAVAAGRYTCTYWARGEGEIRNARFDGDYSSYSGYTFIDGDDWQPVTYTFNLAAATPDFELVFSIRNTVAASGHLSLDDVVCTRTTESCDAVTCEAWQQCDPQTAACITAPDFCADAVDCEPHELCNAEHRCELAPGFCEVTADCAAPSPVCDLSTHTCVAGDPCANVTCDEWEVCDPTDSTCTTSEGRCESLADCGDDAGEGPVCDRVTHSCVAIDDPINVVPNGGFELWSEVSFGGASTFLLPDFWYGLEAGSGRTFPETEITASNVRRYTTSTHGGEAACQLVDTSIPADRFTTEPFTVAPNATYDCAYWVRGQGTYRQRSYCAAWAPDTQFASVDSDAWTQVRFQLSPAASWCVLVFYASNTVAAADHLQIDDVVCTRR